MDEVRIDMYGEKFQYKNSWMIDTHSSKFVIYTGETKTVVLKRGHFMLVCDYGQLYDMINNTCIEPGPQYSSCPFGVRFLGMCVSTCPRDFIMKGQFYNSTTEFICYMECPRWLGWATIADAGAESNYSIDNCKWCEGEKKEDDLAAGSSCMSQCPDKTWQLGKGCEDF